MNPILLENESLRLEFDPLRGTLIGLTALTTGWKILDRPEVGLSFRLLLPLSEERRNNPVYGEKQQLTGISVAPDHSSVIFTWDGLTSEYGGSHDIAVTLCVSLTARQAIYAMKIVNRSGLVVENVYCPYLGDVQHPQEEVWFKTFLYSYASAAQWNLWPKFDNLRGYYGVDFPTQFGPWTPGVGAPMSPFILLRGEKQGLYLGVNQPSCELVAWHAELRPGYGSSIDASVPVERSIAGQPVVTRFAAVHVPYIQPGETRALTPIALEAFQGGWQHGTDIYKRWRDSWMRLPETPAWAHEPHAWQQIHINSPEDELRMPFCDLPKVAVECARYGVKALQLVGWNDGGQDQGNPSHDPDPRLGTWNELKAAIAECQRLGVKVVLFAKFTWADQATPRYYRDLKRLAVKDPYGDPYVYPGYEYQTATQLLDINTKRLIPMCFLSEEYLRVCDTEFEKTVDLGADGILFDECLHHGGALLCFDPHHGHRPGAPVYANDRKLIENFHKISDPARKDFLFAGEACYDWEMEAYHLSYHRSEKKEHIPLSRYMLPQGLFMTAVTGFNDRNMINQCLMYRYVVSYEPYNFKGLLSDFPQTMTYGQQMDALRSELRETFWDGEFRDKVGAQVTCDGKPHHPYAVFLHAQTAVPGLVICNYEDARAITVQAVLETGMALSQYRLVDDPTWKPVSDGIEIPPQSAVVVI